MKWHLKTSLIFSTLLVLAPNGFGSMTAGGRPGNVRVYSAKPAPKGSFSMTYSEEYSRAKDVQFEGMNDLHGSQISLNYTPFSSVQLFLNKRNFLNNNSELLGSLHTVQFSKSELGTMISIPVASNYTVGIEPEFAIFNGNGAALFEASSFGFRLLNTYSYSRGQETLKLHLNNQFFLDQSKKITEAFNFSYFKQNQFYGLANDNAIYHGLGLEIEYPSFTPFVEYTLDQILKKELPVFRSPHRLTSGISFSPRQNSPWKVTLAGEKGFAKKKIDFIPLTPNWNALISISFTDTPPRKIELVEYPIEPIAPETQVKPEEPQKEEVTPEVKKPEEIQSEVKPLYPIYPIVRKKHTFTDYAKIPVTKSKKSVVKDVLPKEAPKTATSPVVVPQTKTVENKRPEKEVDTTPVVTDVIPSKEEFNTFSTEDPGQNSLIHFK